MIEKVAKLLNMYQLCGDTAMMNVFTVSKVTCKNINLEAKGDIVLQAGQNTIHTDVTENSSSTGISAGYSFGAGFGGRWSLDRLHW